MVEVRDVEVFHWNPRRPLVRGRLGALLPKGAPTNNFGDLIGPEIVRRLAGDGRALTTGRRLLAVGSILHFARDGDVVWGSGVNGKISTEEITASQLDVRAVRGPLTAEILLKRGIAVPETYGDPGLLYPTLNNMTRLDPIRKLTIVPNLHDEPGWRGARETISPRQPIDRVVSTIASSEFVAASSLHGLVIADALGIPAALLRPTKESLFKYQDYYEGTGRVMPKVCSSISEAMDHPSAPLSWSPTQLVNAFPADLWPPAEVARDR